MFNLTPLFEGQSQEKHLQTIKDNVAQIAGRLYSSDSQVIADKLELMEQAVRISDKKEREAFVSLISKWHYHATVQVESHKALNCVKAQLESMTRGREPSRNHQ